MTSPPPSTQKKEVLKFRSVNSIVIPPANTGMAKTNIAAVITEAHTNKTSLLASNPHRNIHTVTIKLIEAKIDLIPAICKEKIPKSVA